MSEPDEDPELNDEAVYVVEEIVSHMTFRDACKKFLYGENGFNCETYNDFVHCKYVFQIKWLHWSTANNTWEEERNAEDNEQLILYKKRHGLPSKVESDNFYVQALLINAVKKGDHSVDEAVAKFVRMNWITPFEKCVRDKRAIDIPLENKSKRRMPSRQSRDRSLVRNDRSSSRDTDSGITGRKKLRTGMLMKNKSELNKFITPEEKKRIEKEKKRKVAEEEAQRLADLDELDKLEDTLRKKSKKSQLSSSSRSSIDDERKTEKKRTEAIKEKAMISAQQSLSSHDPDIFESDSHAGTETPKSLAEIPKKKETKGPVRDLSNVPSTSKTFVEKIRLTSSTLHKKSHDRQQPSTSRHFPFKQTDIEHRPKEEKKKPSSVNFSFKVPNISATRKTEKYQLPDIIFPIGNNIKHKSRTEKRDTSSEKRIQPLERPEDINRKSLQDKHAKNKAVQSEGVDIYYNLVHPYKEYSGRCRKLEVEVPRRCQSAEQLNRRWSEPQNNLSKLENWLTSIEKIRPTSDLSESSGLKSLHLDIIWNEKDNEWEKSGNKRIHRMSDDNDFPKFPKAGKSALRKGPILAVDQSKAAARSQAKEPIVITLDEDEEIDITNRNVKGFTSLFKKMKELVPSDRWNEMSDVLAEAPKYYAALEPDMFHNVMKKAPPEVMPNLINEIVQHIQIDTCKEVELRSASNPSSRACQLFEADNAEKKEWCRVTELCTPEHRKCRMLDVILLILDEDKRYTDESIFSPKAFLYCMKYGAICQKKKLLDWGYPFYEGITPYPRTDFIVDHSILIIRQFDPRQLIDLIEMGVDINQMAWAERQKVTGVVTDQWKPMPIMEFFKKLNEQNLDSIPERTQKEMQLVLGRISLQLSRFVQKRMDKIMEIIFPEYSYHGFITPVHIIRSVWPNSTANLMIYIDWEKPWNNYGDVEKDQCVPVDDQTVENLLFEDSKIVITVFRVSLEGQIPAYQSKRVTQNFKIGDLEEGECVPLSLWINGVNLRSTALTIKPIDDTLKPSQWIFELTGEDANIFSRDAQIQVRMKTSSDEIGTTFLLRVHVLNWKAN